MYGICTDEKIAFDEDQRSVYLNVSHLGQIIRTRMSEPSSSGFQPNLFTGCMPFILGPSGLGLAGTLTCNRLWMLYLCVFFLLPSELVHLVESLKQPMRVQIFTLQICICNIGLCDFHCPHSFISCNFAFVMLSTSFQNICTS